MDVWICRSAAGAAVARKSPPTPAHARPPMRTIRPCCARKRLQKPGPSRALSAARRGCLVDDKRPHRPSAPDRCVACRGKIICSGGERASERHCTGTALALHDGWGRREGCEGGCRLPATRLPLGCHSTARCIVPANRQRSVCITVHPIPGVCRSSDPSPRPTDNQR
jgi:hypothetical protein